MHGVTADLVVLSGCSTAGGRQFGGEGVLGLSYALLASGTRQVVSTQWAVADAASAVVMKAFYEELIRNQRHSAFALQHAQILMLQSSRWQHPRHWAAYSLIGH